MSGLCVHDRLRPQELSRLHTTFGLREHYCLTYCEYFAAIGIRRPTPKAFDITLSPGAA